MTHNKKSARKKQNKDNIERATRWLDSKYHYEIADIYVEDFKDFITAWRICKRYANNILAVEHFLKREESIGNKVTVGIGDMLGSFISHRCIRVNGTKGEKVTFMPYEVSFGGTLIYLGMPRRKLRCGLWYEKQTILIYRKKI